MTTRQDEILAPVPKLARFLTLGLVPDADPRSGLLALSERLLDPGLVVGLGAPLASRLGVEIPELTVFPALSASGLTVPSTQGALWLCLGGDDAGELMVRARSLISELGAAFRLDEEVLSYRYGSGRDLTGYEDGTENPRARPPRALRSSGIVARVSMAVASWQFSALCTRSVTSRACRSANATT